MFHSFRESQGFNGEPIEFELTIFPGATALEFLHTTQKDLEGQRKRPESFNDRKIFMSMFNDLDLDKKGNEDSCIIHFEENQDVRVKIQ